MWNEIKRKLSSRKFWFAAVAELCILGAAISGKITWDAAAQLSVIDAGVYGVIEGIVDAIRKKEK